MPPLPGIQREELVALVAFVRSLSHPDLQEVELHPLTGRTVDGFVPVTAAKLGDPDPGDWLMYRRTWNAWGFSPLDQVSRENVSRLTLAWSRAMEPGEQETTPLALHEETGEIAWYYQHLPRDNWDMDHVFERLLVDTRVRPNPCSVQWINPALDRGEAHKVVTGIPGKTGIIYTLNRETGKFLWATPTLNQNLVTHIDTATGEVHIDENLVVDAFEEILVCPGRAGGKNWPSGAYNPNTGLMYQPQQNLCMLHTGNAASPTPEEVYASSVVFVEDPTIDQTPYPVGRVDAVSIESGRVAWTHQQRAGMLSGLVATAGGLVFGGDANRRFKAFDDLSGQVLWETILSGPVTGHPISYQADGRQYIAVPVGGGTAEPERRVLSIHPEMKPSRGINAIFVFALPSDGELPGN